MKSLMPCCSFLSIEEKRGSNEDLDKAHTKALHVLGNHEIDKGHSFEQVAKLWGMKGVTTQRMSMD